MYQIEVGASQYFRGLDDEQDIPFITEYGCERTIEVAKQSAIAILENHYRARRDEITWDDNPAGQSIPH